MLTPHEKLTGTPRQKREISERLVRFRQHPDRTLTLSETHPTLTFQTLDLSEGAAPPLASHVKVRSAGFTAGRSSRRVGYGAPTGCGRKLVRRVRFGYAFRSTEA